jgi:fatty-acyl-CoA synthase
VQFQPSEEALDRSGRMIAPSYVSGVGAQPLIGETIGRCFDAVCDAHADKLALVVRHQDVRWTYGDLRQRVDTLAAALLRFGLEPGDRLGIWAPNCAEWLVAQYATAKLGVILVNINPAYRTAEVEYALNKVQCKALILARQHKSSDYLAMLRELAPELARGRPGDLAAARLPHLRVIVTLGEGGHPGCLRFDELLAVEGPEHRLRVREIGARLQFDEPVNIQFTSGTTGAPKGATLSHHNILNNGFFVGEAIGLGPDDKICVPVPLYHCFGMVMANLACLTHAATLVYPSAAFDPLAVLQAVAEEGCTGLYGVPTMFIAVLGHPELARFDLSRLRTGIMAGAPCPVEVMRQVVDRLHMGEITIAYGMTETSPVSFQSSLDDPLERRVTTVGRIHPHLEVKIVDDGGRILPRGVPGELCTRGYSVMLGYWDDPERSAEAVDRSGWMHTGDLAVLDEAGYCKIVGRIKDVVIRGGENIYPREIEEFLYRHPAVQDVQVVGVPDARFGEELCAWVILKAGMTLETEALHAFCRGQIAHYKIPRFVRFVDAFPITVTGKVQKFQIRKAMIEELGIAVEATA